MGLIYIVQLILFLIPFQSQAKDCSLEGLTNDCAALRSQMSALSNLNSAQDPKEREKRKELIEKRKKETQIQYSAAILENFNKRWNSTFLAKVTSPDFFEAFSNNLENKPLTACWPPDKGAECKEKTLTPEEFNKLLRTPSSSQSEFDFEFIASSYGDFARLEPNPLEESPNQAGPNPKSVKNMEKKAGELIETVKGHLIEVLKKKVSDPSEFGRMKRIIETIKYGGVNGGSELCKDNQPNAFYFAATHTFELCASMALLPEFDLIQTIAHEIAHSVDPCNYFLPVGLPDKSQQLYTRLKIITDPSKKNKSQELVTHLDSQSTYPLASVERCLSDEFGLISKNKGDLTKTVVQERTKAKILGTTDPTPSDGLLSFFGSQSSEECINSSNQMGETMADWMATEVLAEMSQKQELPKESLPFGFLAEACRQKINLEIGRMRPGDVGQIAFDTHPITRDRVDLFFSQPIIRKLYSCTKNEKAKPYCSMGGAQEASPGGANTEETSQ